MTIKKWTYAVGFTAGLALVACSGENGTDGAPGADGADGTSCVAEALEDGSGFDMICGGKSVGTVKNGEDGANGKDGTNGKNGADGKNGTNGTNGTDGKDGTSCVVKPFDGGFKVLCAGDSVGVLVNGVDGTNGKDGANGTDGTNGTNGKSAYELAVAAGFEGTEAEWLASLKGADGTNGTNGTNGTDGTNGTNGKSAYELAVEAGFEGTEAQWLAALKGDKGDAGDDGVSCVLTDNNDGTVTVTCGASSTTLFKAVCGTTAYDPAEQFCADGLVYDLCGDKVFDPTKQFCLDEIVLDLCGEDTFDPAEKFCFEKQLYDFCGGEIYNPSKQFCDTRKGGRIYKYVKIGSQTWMAENLNYDPGQGGAGATAYDWSWCVDDDPDKCSEKGRLYTWAAAIDSVKLANDTENPMTCGYNKYCEITTATSQGVCPEGWHLPNTDEWNVLFTAVGGLSDAGVKLKSKSGWYNNGNGTDDYGFSLLPAGSWKGFSSYSNEYARLWTFAGENVYETFFSYEWNKVTIQSTGDKEYGLSVRCIKDADE